LEVKWKHGKVLLANCRVKNIADETDVLEIKGGCDASKNTSFCVGDIRTAFDSCGLCGMQTKLVFGIKWDSFYARFSSLESLPSNSKDDSGSR
jgi:hypothetical protein